MLLILQVLGRDVEVLFTEFHFRTCRKKSLRKMMNLSVVSSVSSTHPVTVPPFRFCAEELNLGSNSNLRYSENTFGECNS